ncbi:hypothetical protein ACH4A8_20090 [Streptomyces vietnamensis]|uniref:hypothetical protein n=1 Tax=Streptomyces vietnamensis TaxID=362257 RepID=UPI00378B5A3C
MALVDPWLRGRRVPIPAAVIPAGLGATFNTLRWPYAMTMISMGRGVDGALNPAASTHGRQDVIFYVAYWPLAAWGAAARHPDRALLPPSQGRPGSFFRIISPTR